MPSVSGNGNADPIAGLAHAPIPGRAEPVCSFPKPCTKCMAQTTKASCESFGVDCTCTHSTAPGATAVRRRLQGGAATVQVQAGGESKLRLNSILDCLEKGKAFPLCVVNASTLI